LVEFLESTKSKVAIQLFEDYLLELYSNKELKCRLWDLLSTKCAILNLNENELLHLSRLYWGGNNNHKPNDFLEIDQILDRLASELQNTVILVGFGSAGASLVCRTNNSYHKICMPTKKVIGAFGVGGGDTALASAIASACKILSNKGHIVSDLTNSIQDLTRKDFESILRDFVFAGLRASINPDIFTYNNLPSKYQPKEPVFFDRVTDLLSLQDESKLLWAETKAYNELNAIPIDDIEDLIKKSFFD
jgi:hypothetical protein